MLTTFDKALLNTIQTDLPVASRPYAEIAKRLSVTEDEVLERLRYLKERGFIRRIGPFFDSASLGYVSTLVAVLVKDEYVESVAQAINEYQGVTHNYERDGQFNLWFALITPSLDVQRRILNEISSLPGVERLISLPAVKKFKVSVQFSL